jgi:hypothetical protein
MLGRETVNDLRAKEPFVISSTHFKSCGMCQPIRLFDMRDEYRNPSPVSMEHLHEINDQAMII